MTYLSRREALVAVAVALLGVLACSVTTPTAQPSRLTEQFTVQANQGWNDTGIQVDAGALVEVEYQSGVWTYWPGQISPFDADGNPQPYICATLQEAAQCVEPLPEANKGALIARVGDATAIYIGNHSAFSSHSGNT